MISEDYRKLLSCYADNKEHGFFEASILGRVLLKKSDRQILKIFKRMLEYGWLKRLWKSPFEVIDMYTLTPKGDKCFRSAQLSRLSREKHTEEARRHYELFNRETSGQYGVEGMSSDYITETTADLRRKHPELYRPIDE